MSKKIKKVNFDVQESITPEVDEVEIEENGSMIYIYLINEKGKAMKVCLHRDETDKLMHALYQISAHHKLYSN